MLGEHNYRQLPLMKPFTYGDKIISIQFNSGSSLFTTGVLHLHGLQVFMQVLIKVYMRNKEKCKKSHWILGTSSVCFCLVASYAHVHCGNACLSLCVCYCLYVCNCACVCFETVLVYIYTCYTVCIFGVFVRYAVDIT